MKNRKIKFAFVLMFAFMFLFSSVGSVYAAKPVKAINVAITGATSDSVTYDVGWDNIGASHCWIYVDQYYNVEGTHYTGYTIGMDEITLARRTASYPIISKTTPLLYAQFSHVPASGSYCKVRVVLLDRKYNIIAEGVSPTTYLIP